MSGQPIFAPKIEGKPYVDIHGPNIPGAKYFLPFSKVGKHSLLH